MAQTLGRGPDTSPQARCRTTPPPVSEASAAVVSGPVHTVLTMLIDCDSCTARPRACGDCVVTHLLSVGSAAPPLEHSSPRPAADLTSSEIAAVGVLAAGGLVPPLRLVTESRPA